MLSPNVIIPFDGNHADIPSGFSRDTRFDGKFPKGASSGYGGTDGSDTHTHTASHTHTIEAHLHKISMSNPIDGNTHDVGHSGSITGANHSHNGEPGTPNTGSEVSGTTAATLTASANLPPYYEVIFLKSDSYNVIPIDGMIFAEGDRDGMDYHTASEDMFLRGAATEDDAGGTGGTETHTHSQSHTHTANNHSHPGAYVNEGTAGDSEGGMFSPQLATGGHKHTVSVSSASQAMNSNSTASDSGDNIPVNKTLKHYIATAKTLPKKGDIAMTTESTIPVGWLECDGENDTPDLQDYFIKNAETSGVETGENTHTHVLSHSHTGNGTHTHSYSSPSGYSDSHENRASNSGETGREQHRHNVTAVENKTANYAVSAPTSTEVNNEPSYIKVRFIQYQYGVGGAALFAMV